jgi:acyl carrier protein
MGLDGVELILTTEDKFGITISENDLSEIRTVRNLTELVVRLVREQKKGSPDPETITQEIMEIIKEISGKLIRKPITLDTELTDVLSM